MLLSIGLIMVFDAILTSRRTRLEITVFVWAGIVLSVNSLIIPTRMPPMKELSFLSAKYIAVKESKSSVVYLFIYLFIYYCYFIIIIICFILFLFIFRKIPDP